MTLFKIMCEPGFQEGWFCDVCERCSYSTCFKKLHNLPTDDDPDIEDRLIEIDLAINEAEKKVCDACKEGMWGFPREQAHCSMDCKNCSHAFTVVTLTARGTLNCSGEANTKLKKIR